MLLETKNNMKKDNLDKEISMSDDFIKYMKTYIPERFHNTIIKSYELLKKKGCSNIYLFGSLVKMNTNEYSDVDIGVKGLPKEYYYRMIYELYYIDGINVDLIDFDFETELFKFLKEIGTVKEIE